MHLMVQKYLGGLGFWSRDLIWKKKWFLHYLFCAAGVCYVFTTGWSLPSDMVDYPDAKAEFFQALKILWTPKCCSKTRRPRFKGVWDDLKDVDYWIVIPSPRHFIRFRWITSEAPGWIHGCRYWEHRPFTATKSGTASITAHGVDVQNPDIAARALAFGVFFKARLTPVPNNNPGIMPILSNI